MKNKNIGEKLEVRTYEYARSVLRLCRSLKYLPINRILISQACRSSSSVGANYIEANEASSRKDFLYRLKITRKEVKESVYHLRLLQDINKAHEMKFDPLIREGIELR